jgi:hypothetical protein
MSCILEEFGSNAINPLLCIREKCSRNLKFTGKCIRKILDFGSLKNQDGLSN